MKLLVLIGPYQAAIFFAMLFIVPYTICLTLAVKWIRLAGGSFITKFIKWILIIVITLASLLLYSKGILGAYGIVALIPGLIMIWGIATYKNKKTKLRINPKSDQNVGNI